MTARHGSSKNRADRSSLVLSWILLWATALNAPLWLLESNLGRMSREYRLAFYAAAVVGILSSLGWVLARCGASFPSAAAALATAWLVQAKGLPVSDSVQWVLAVVLAGITYRLFNWSVFRNVIVVATVVLIGGPVVQIGLRSFDQGSPPLLGSAHVSRPGLGGAPPTVPDAWLIVLDGFASGDTSEELGFRPEISEVFDRHEFEFNLDASTPYPVTHLALPAILEVFPIAGAGTVLDATTWSELRRITGGDNLLVNAFTEAGYKVATVENGWHLGGCGPQIHICIAAPPLDGMTAGLLGDTMLGRVIGISEESAFAAGVRQVLATGRDAARNGWGVDDPYLTILHLLAPHPPFSVDDECEPKDLDEGTSGFPFFRPEASEEIRQLRIELFSDQTACVVGWLDQILMEIPETDLVGVVGDHGTDSQGQLFVPPNQWSAEMLRERFHTVAAFRGPETCNNELEWVIDVTESLVECVGSVSVADVDPRSYLLTADESGLAIVSDADSGAE